MATILTAYKIKFKPSPDDDSRGMFFLDPRHDMRASLSEPAKLPRRSELILPTPEHWLRWDNYAALCKYLWYTVIKP